MRTKIHSISRRLQFLFVAGASSFALLVAACGGDDAPADPVPGGDAAVGDATSDARPDGSTPADGSTSDARADGGDAAADARTDAGDASTTADGGDASTTADGGDASTTTDAGDAGATPGTLAAFIIDQINNHTTETDLPNTTPFDTPDPYTDSEDQALYAPLF